MERGLSPVVGMVMVLAIIAGFMSVLQTQQLPHWNKQKEAEHYRLLVSEFSRIPYVLSTGTTASVSLDAGLDYPDVPLLINPPDAVSTLQFEKRNVSVSYSLVMPDGNIEKISKNYTSYAIILKPHYFYSPERELVLEHGAILEKWANSKKPVPVTKQVAFTESRITIPILNATAGSTTADKFSLKLSPASYGGEFVAKNVNITFETEFADWWNDTLAKIYGSDKVRETDNNTTITVMLPEASIDISSYSVGGQNQDTDSVVERKLELLVPFQSNIVVSAGSVERIDVQAVDNFGNPISGLVINATVNATLGDVTPNATTDVRGIASFYFTAGNSGSGYINFSATYGETRNASVGVTIPGVEIVAVSNGTTTHTFHSGQRCHDGCRCRFGNTLQINVTARITTGEQDKQGKLINFVLMKDSTATDYGAAVTNETGYATCRFSVNNSTYTIYAYYGTAYDNVTVFVG